MRTSVILVILILTITIPVTGQSIQADELDSFFEHLYQHNRFMGSVAVLSGDEMVYQHSEGYANVEEEMFNSDQTRFHIGSVTKTFTATIILRLADEGKLSLDEPLADYYPDFQDAGQITLSDMLYHRSGLFNFTNDPEYTEWMTEPKSRGEMLELLQGYELQFEPDSRTEYSNANYVLLGYIIEDITGNSYQEALEEYITGPLDLNDTYYGRQISPDRNEAYSYEFSGGWEKMPETDMSIPHGAGALVSSPADMVRFGRALFSGEVLDQPYLDQMTDLQERFGMGLISYPYHDKSGFGHSGGIDGFQANLAIYPEDDLFVATTANALSFSNNEILVALLDAWHGEQIELPEFDTVDLPAEHLQALSGDYNSEQIALEISIWEEDGTLMAQATGQQAFPMEASSENRFRFDQAGLVIEFHADEQDEYRSFTLFQGGQEYLFERK